MGQTRVIRLRDAGSQRIIAIDPSLTEKVRLCCLPTADEQAAFRLGLTADVLRRTLERLGVRVTVLPADQGAADIALLASASRPPSPEFSAHLGLLEIGPVVDGSGSGAHEVVQAPALHEEAGELARRYFALTARYDLPLLYSPTGLDSAACALRQLTTRVAELAERGAPATEPSNGASELRDRFLSALSDGLDTSAALGLVWTALRADLSTIERQTLLLDFDDVLQLGLAAAASPMTEALPSGAQALIQERAAARERKDWARSDTLRSQLTALGVETRDTPRGSEYRRAASTSG